MLSEKEMEFVRHWEKIRESRAGFMAKLTGGLPMAVLFCVPILLFVASVYLFFPSWYTKISKNLPGSVITIVIAVFICVLFFSYFRMQFKWEANEQLYRELKSRMAKAEQHAQSN